MNGQDRKDEQTDLLNAADPQKEAESGRAEYTDAIVERETVSGKRLLIQALMRSPEKTEAQDEEELPF